MYDIRLCFNIVLYTFLITGVVAFILNYVEATGKEAISKNLIIKNFVKFLTKLTLVWFFLLIGIIIANIAPSFRL